MGNYPAVNSNPKYQEYVNYASFPASSVTGYVAKDMSTGNYYQWDGTAWVQINTDILVWLDCESAVEVGDPVYWHQDEDTFDDDEVTPTGELRQASADSASTAGVVGIVVDRSETEDKARIAGNGSYAAIGGSLTVGQPYYLGSGTANIVATPPSELGWVQIGVARSATELDIFIHPYGILPQ